MNKTIRRSASLIFAIVLMFGTFIPGRASSQNAVVMPNQIVNLAHFYKPPINSDAATVARSFSTIVLTGGDENYVNQLVSNGNTNAISQYVRSEAIQDPGNCTSNPSNNQIASRAGEFCWISQNHPEWFLLDANGNRMRTSPTSNYYRMDYGHPGWQAYFVARLIERQNGTSWSGLFLDNLEASLAAIQNSGLASQKYSTDASYQAAVISFLQYLQNNYSTPYGRPIVANIVAKREDATFTEYMRYLSAGMKECWAVDWGSQEYNTESKWLKDLTAAEETQAQGKHIILVAQGDKADTARQKFAFASYLLISNGKAAFRYGNDDIYNEIWMYDNYRLNLGTPLGARYQTGSVWRRDFANGYVTVDPISHAATISANSTPAPTSTVAPASTPTNAPTNAPAFTPTNAPTNAPASTPTNTAINTPAPSEVVYDSRNAAFVYSSGWSDVSDANAYSGSFKLTQTLNSYVSVNFTGQTFSIIYKTGPLFGKMGVYVDGSLLGTIDQYTSTAAFQRRWSYGGTLTSGTHTLKLVYTSPSSSRVSIDAISLPSGSVISAPSSSPTQIVSTPTATRINTATPVPTTTVYDNRNAAFVYSSGWSDVTDANAYGGSFKLTQTLNSYVTLNFTGQTFSVIYKTGPLFGKMNVYVDGRQVGTIDQYTSTATFQRRWSYGGTLTAGAHTLKLVYASPSGARVSVDAVSIP